MTTTDELTNPNTLGDLPVVMKDTIDVSNVSAKALITQRLSQDIPVTELGLLEYYYRSDLIPDDLFSLPEETRHEYLNQSICDLDYSQGYPTLANTEPFWGKLEHEPVEAYRAFVAYMDLPRTPATRSANRMLTNVDPHPLSHLDASVPVRQLHLLRTIVPGLADNLMDCYFTFYWAERVRAYDLFNVAHHTKMKEYRLMNAEDSHFNKAELFIDYCQKFLEDVFADPENAGLKPKEAMDMMFKMMQMQRISAGAAPTTGAQTNSESALPKNASVEVVLKHIAQQAGVKVGQVTNEDMTRNLLNDPEALRQAQDLVIKLQDNGEARVLTDDFDDLEAAVPVHQDSDMDQHLHKDRIVEGEGSEISE